MLVSDIRTAEWGDAVEAIERCYELGWTDGLPVVPPTVERVEKALSYAGRPADEVLGWIPERRREITVEKVAANAVMAGCLPEYLPVVIAATEAMMDVAFNLIAPSSSQGGASILLIVNGPIVEELGINCRNNLFGPGNRANSTIGRAIRLILMNACASIPGLFDRSLIGDPSKYTFCIGENETDTHWTPLHVESGLPADESAVTVFAGWGPRQMRAASSPEAILDTAADVASSLGSSLCTSDSVGDTSAGMRLATGYGTVRRHNGTLDLESEVGQGTTFIITLPITSEQLEESSNQKVEAAPPRPLRILAVDDEPTVLAATPAMLSVDGHQVETATNGRDALDKFIAAPFDLVVTDRAMPEMSGDQLAVALRTVAPGPVIPMTGFGDIMSATGEKPAGVDMILTKPATLNTLREAVAKVISDWDGELGTQPRAPVPSAL